MYRYVVIDDEALIRRAIVKKIASLELPLAWVGEAEDGEEGLALALRERPDIVLTDMRMPAMDGVSLLRALTEQQPETALIVISGYSDFEYTREAISANVIDYILKPFDNRELRASLDKALAFLQRQEAHREAEHAHALAVEGERLAAWLCRSCADERAPLRAEQYRAEPIRALLAAESLAVGVLAAASAAQASTSGDLISGDAPLSDASLPGGAARLDGAGMLWLPHPERLEVTLLLVGSRIGAGQLAIDRLRRAVAATERAGDGALAAASRACSRPEALRAAYREAIGLLERRPFDLRSGLLERGGAGPRPAEWRWAGRDDLLCEVEQGRLQPAASLCEALFVSFVEGEGATFAQARAYCAQLAEEIEERRPQGEESTLAAERPDRVEAIRQATGEAELAIQLDELVRETVELVLAGSLTAVGQIGQIRHFIDQRYDQSIRLEEVAERFYLHPVYLSMVFKESVGETFQDYLKRRRMERAKELLAATRYRIDRIAALVGYDNAKYFYKVFKKETGLTPADFRRRQTDEPAGGARKEH